MATNLTSVTLDTPFREQGIVQDFLYPTDAGPVDSGLCYRLLGVAEQAIRDELDKSPDKKTLEGLRIGYWDTTMTGGEITEETPVYTFQWGLLPSEDLPENDAPYEEEKLRDPTINPLGFSFIDDLAVRVRDELSEHTAGSKTNIHVFLDGSHNGAFFGVGCCYIQKRRRVYSGGTYKCTGSVCGQS